MQVFYISALFIFLLDRLTKYLVLRSDYTILEVTPFLNLVKVWNKGIAFGVMAGASNTFSILLILLTPLILIFLYFYARKTDKTNKALIGMIFGGGLGNWMDRISFGAVLDFIDFHYKNYHWPAFNIADAGITLGLILLVLRNVFKN